jgi:beta-N-acetylhexosaminidase
MQQFMVSFVGNEVPKEVKQGIAEGKIASICLFAGTNVESPAQVRAMNEEMFNIARENGHPPPIIGIDQEGGQLIAITGGATELPGNMALGATRSAELARQAGEVLGRELLAMGVNMNFAPSLDVNNNPLNPVIGIRSFSDDPHLVAELGIAITQGMQDLGILATAKHFPGHGDTQGDSHHDAPVVNYDVKRLHEIELHPFKQAIASGIKTIMTSHILYTALDADEPATLSASVITGILRKEMQFGGLIVTDAMDMHAVARQGTQQSLTKALNAGADLILLGHIPDQMKLLEQFTSQANDESLHRIQELRASLSFELPALEVVGQDEHQTIAQNIADASITIVRDRQNAIPLQLTGQVAVITVRPADLTPADTSSQVDIVLAERIRARHANTIALEIAHNPDDAEIASVLQQVSQADTVIMGTITAEQYPQQAELVRQLHQQSKRLIVVSMRTPYDIVAFPEIETYVCAYGIRAVTCEAIARILAGEMQAQGQLPCKIPNIAPDSDFIV